MLEQFLPFLMFLFSICLLLLGYPVAFTLAGSSLIFAAFGYFSGYFDWIFIAALPERLFGIMGNENLIAVPLFIFMGVLLEKTKISENLLDTMGLLMKKVQGGLGVSICLVGTLLAASTGIVGATVVTMGLLSLPVMLRHKYSPSFSCGIITAAGTLGQIIPPSIVLIILGDVISSAYQQAQLASGNFSGGSVSVGDLFLGALFPGLLLVTFYIIYIIIVSTINPSLAPPIQDNDTHYDKKSLLKKVILSFLPPIILILSVLGSILIGLATPTEAASVGCIGAIILAVISKQLTKKVMQDVLKNASQINCMVFIILIGSSVFSLVFRGYHGDDIITSMFEQLPGGVVGAFLLVMIVMFILGFFLDFFEITFIVVPVIGPILLQMGLNPIWLGVMIAMNLQTSFLTPPFGFALFYLRGVAPPEVTTQQIYKGVIPFIIIQIIVMVLLWFLPEIVTWLPFTVYSN